MRFCEDGHWQAFKKQLQLQQSVLTLQPVPADPQLETGVQDPGVCSGVGVGTLPASVRSDPPQPASDAISHTAAPGITALREFMLPVYRVSIGRERWAIR